MAYILGLMCGTSADGVSGALVEWPAGPPGTPPPAPPSELVLHVTHPFAPALRQRLLRLYPPGRFSAEELLSAELEVSRAIASTATALLDQAGVRPDEVRLLAFQGPILFYRPPASDAAAGVVVGAAPGEPGATDGAGAYELGDAAVVAALTGVPAANRLRSNDMAVGGRGAPLTAWFDWWQLGHPSKGRIVENIGGIANVTVLPPGAPADRVMAFDVGPGNMVIDAVVRHLTEGAETFDRDGQRASRGRLHAGLLEELQAHPYLHRPPPKTTGREEFGQPYVEAVLQRASSLGVSGDDLVATVTELTASATDQALRRFVLPGGRFDELVLAGGGAYNPALVGAIRRRLGGLLEVTPIDALGLPADAREAVAWAVMAAVSLLHGQTATLPAVTGAARPARLGALTWPA